MPCKAAAAMAAALWMVFASLPAFADEGGDEYESEEKRPLPEGAHPNLLEPPGPVEIPDIDNSEVSVESIEVESFSLLGDKVAPGKMQRLSWYASETSAGLAEPTPVLVAHGAEPGPTLCLVAAVHGDELNGIEIVRNLLYDLDPARLSGTIIGVPIVNLQGFRQGSRYLPDRRDLNRYFPGNPRGSSASRIAHSFFNAIVRKCNYLVDLHTGSFQRSNLPQLRADLDDEAVLHLTKGFGATAVLQKRGPEGSLRGTATKAGIPAVTLEVGEPMRVQPEEVKHGVKALRSLLNYLDMVPRFSLWGEPQPIYYESKWVRTESYGIHTSKVKLGETVSKGDLLGKVVDPISNGREEIRSPYAGRVIGKAANQTMRPGYAVYHIGIRKSEEELEKKDSPDPEDRPDEDAERKQHTADKEGSGDEDTDLGEE